MVPPVPGGTEGEAWWAAAILEILQVSHGGTEGETWWAEGVFGNPSRSRTVGLKVKRGGLKDFLEILQVSHGGTEGETWWAAGFFGNPSGLARWD